MSVRGIGKIYGGHANRIGKLASFFPNPFGSPRAVATAIYWN
jgi:hypothetical protein